MKMKILLWAVSLFTCINYVSGQSTALEDLINTYVKEKDFSGSILVEKNDQITYHGSFGLANRPFKVVNTDRTKFKIASITKLFTSVLIMQLYEQGQIDLTHTINRYLPDYLGEGADKITIHHLLNHTSGLPYVGPKSKEEALEQGIEELQLPHTVDDLIVKYHSRNLVNEPGTVFNYNNGDYIILGKIIERIYGKKFEEVLHQQILDPLKMVNSGLLFQYEIIQNLSDSYFNINDSSGLVHDIPVYIENWYAAGAMYSTTSDLRLFTRALFSQILLNHESLQILLNPGLEDYGYGLWVYDIEKQEKKYQVIKRPGEIMGARANLVYLPEEKLTIILLANTDSVDLDDFSYQIMIAMIE